MIAREKIWNRDCHERRKYPTCREQSRRRHEIGQAETNNSTEYRSFLGLRGNLSLITAGHGANIECGLHIRIQQLIDCLWARQSGPSPVAERKLERDHQFRGIRSKRLCTSMAANR